MLRRKNFRWLGALAMSSLFIALLYAVGTRKFAYERTFGFWLVLLVMGIAGLWNSAEALTANRRRILELV